MDDQILALKDKFPFLTYGKYLNDYHLGIMQNCDTHIVSLYILTDIPTKELRNYFLKCGETWWWESNRQIPINIFLRNKFEVFKPYLKTYIKKDFEILFGPTVSLQDMMNKRIKRRTVQLIRDDV